ncbi:FadR/GntR family transcriptional regulator [Kribbella sp. CA-293567]|uniref:FadR/GntR family transcriptional regulator n=1 Tax=Kribbella sp. CA-293567 TaxID=3002436 RepID=UPI0022DD39AA|nr:FCD domain-containing protein [Kribbella sp. CA-293567]WBQ04166.1 GntR family transcriptional regulator [Kribbella sp. CA-293567]
MAGVATADEAVFRPVRAGNPFEETVERLLQAIKLGVVAPGERLPAERDLAARLSVSRVTLREAIKVLTDSGYVESRRGRYGGTFVNERLPKPRRIGPKRIARELGDGLDDALVLRAALEVGAAEAAASRQLSPEEHEHLRGRLADSAGAKLADYRRMDSRLHLAIAELSGSPSLTSAVADVRMRLNALLDAIPLLERNIVHSDEQHRAVVEAILTGDAPGARAAMHQHVAGSAALLRAFLS